VVQEEAAKMIRDSATILFDLDGTLADTSDDIYRSLNETLKKFNIEEVSFDIVLDFIGDGVKPLIQKILKYLGRIEEEPLLFQEFLRHYRKNISKSTYVYPGVLDLIFHLKQNNFQVILLTNKLSDLTVKLLSELCILNVFDGIVCGDTFEVKKPSEELLKKIYHRYDIKGSIFIIGDGLNDFLFALNSGSNFILAKWGFPTKKVEEYIKTNFPDQKIFQSPKPSDALKIILNHVSGNL